jgi:hypothetical protein
MRLNCKICGMEMFGGISHLKYHLAKIPGNEVGIFSSSREPSQLEVQFSCPPSTFLHEFSLYHLLNCYQGGVGGLSLPLTTCAHELTCASVSCLRLLAKRSPCGNVSPSQDSSGGRPNRCSKSVDALTKIAWRSVQYNLINMHVQV